VVDDGQHEGFRLAGTGSRAEDDVVSGADGLDRLDLVPVQLVVGEHALAADDLVQQALADQLGDGGAGPEGAVEVDIRPFVEQRVPPGGEAHLLADLGGEALVGDGERGEQVAPELVDDVAGKLDRVKGHGEIPSKCSL